MEPPQSSLFNGINYSRTRRVEDYRVTHGCASGGRTVYGPGIEKKGAYLPLEEALKESLLKSIKRRRRIRSRDREYLKNYGLLHETNPSRSIARGAEVLGIETPAKLVYEEYRTEAERAVRSFWPADESKKYVNNSTKYPAPRIVDFAKRHPAKYKWIKANEGMHEFLEFIRPGLYNVITRRTHQESLDKEKLGEELRRAMAQGITLTELGLGASRDADHNRWRRQIIFAKENRILSRDKLTFNETVAKLTGLPLNEIRGLSVGARECAELGEKFVQFYLVWAKRLNFDPLDLGLSKTSKVQIDYAFDSQEENHRRRPRNHFLAFDFSGNKKGIAYADGRVDNRAIEVKVGIEPVNGLILEDLIGRYGNGHKWKTGEKMSGATVFLYQEPRLYLPVLGKLEGSGLKVAGFDEFEGSFSSLLHRAMKKEAEKFEEVRPRFHADALLDAHRSLSLERRLLLFSRIGFTTHRKWINDMLTEAITAGESE